MTKLIFCFDGTCNDPADAGDFFHDSSISNVLKLHALFGGKLNPPNGENSQMSEQRSFYYSGIGTYGGWMRQKLNAMFAPPSADMNDIIAAAKEDLEGYKEGDEIFIFGFSRGAAIARMFASKIGKENKPIKFLGVFDTVAAIKGPDLDPDTFPASGILFENGTMGQHIESAVHLVAIDEKRIAFQPTLFNKDDKRITEVWFAGVHSDIGGGYWFDGLSDITLKFMCDRAKGAGLQILDVEKIDYQALREEKDLDEEAICEDDILIRPHVGGVLHEQHRPNIARKTLAPRIVRVSVDDDTSQGDAPIIHHTVCDRFDKVTGYRPYALRNTDYRVMDKNGAVGEVRTGVAMLSNKNDK